MLGNVDDRRHRVAPRMVDGVAEASAMRSRSTPPSRATRDRAPQPDHPFHSLAELLRPKSLNEVVAQPYLSGSGKPLRLKFGAGKLHSLIL